MSMNFSKAVKPTCVLGYISSTGASTTYSNKIDMAGFDGVCYTLTIAGTGASTGTGTFTVVGTNTSTAASTSYAAITGASVSVAKSTSAGVGKYARIDMFRPRYRYLKAKWVATAKIITCGVVAQQYDPTNAPITPSSTTDAASTVAASNVLLVYQTT